MALGFWKALQQVYGDTRQRRCWVHKRQNVLPKAAECLRKDQEALLAFYDFPAKHWQHIRTTNPIESTFATLRLRTNKTRNTFSRISILTLVYTWCLNCVRQRTRGG